MLKHLGRLLFSFSGRIPRSTFWWTLMWLGFAFIVLFVFPDKTAGYAITLILYPPFLGHWLRWRRSCFAIAVNRPSGF